jgi:hypothetical protein
MAELPRTPFKSPTNATSICVQLAILGVCFALSYSLGWGAGMGLGAIAILIELSSPLRKQAWFWSAVAVFVAIHV